MNSVVSIIIPCYNQAKFLEETLYSILSQTYSNWECLIINDGSTDKTEKIAEQFTVKDQRFKYFYKENGGLSSARNFGLDKAKGNYIQFLDSDDYIVSNKLQISIDALNYTENKNKQIVISNFRMFENNVENWSNPYCDLQIEYFTFENILLKWDEYFSIPIHCGFFDSSLFQNLRFNENLRAKEDWVMWVQLFQTNIQSVFIDKPLALYRKNPESITATQTMANDFLNAYDFFKTILTQTDFEKLSKVLISRYYYSNSKFKKLLNETKQSNSYKLGFTIKTSLKKIGILKVFKILFASLFNKKNK
jgi:glycosyltransferase involved in cell wall biosynthesis